MLRGITAGIAIGVALAAAVLFICFKKHKGQPCSPSPSVHLSSGLREYTLKQVRGFTNEFSDEQRLGKGGFGSVYRGALTTGEQAAVKRLKVGSEQGEREFLNEVEILSRAHHRHIVSLLGCCSEGPERILVYELARNNSLEFHLRGEGLDWTARMKIALGSAKGLAYLHDGQPKILHRDIKAANILLDSNFEAKIGDFGLAKCIFDSRSHVSTMSKGTPGYLAPEYLSGKLTEKSDIYSFGIVMLELITGRIATSFTELGLVDWAMPQLTGALEDENLDSVVDPRLQNNYDNSEMSRLVACAAACVRRSAKRRPKMTKIVRALEGDLPLSDLDDGIRPGLRTLYRLWRGSDDGTGQDPGNSGRMSLASQEDGSSHYSNRASGSSSEGRRRQTTIDLEMQTMGRDDQGFSGGS